MIIPSRRKSKFKDTEMGLGGGGVEARDDTEEVARAGHAGLLRLHKDVMPYPEGNGEHTGF